MVDGFAVAGAPGIAFGKRLMEFPLLMLGFSVWATSGETADVGARLVWVGRGSNLGRGGGPGVGHFFS